MSAIGLDDWNLCLDRVRLMDRPLLFFIASGLITALVYTSSASGQDNAWRKKYPELYTALRILEDGFAGKTVDIEKSFVNGYGDTVVTSTARVSLSSDRSFLREVTWGRDFGPDDTGEFVSGNGTVTHRNERCCFQGQEIRIRQNLRNGEGPLIVAGKIELPDTQRFSILFPGHLGGYCGDDRIPFTEILSMPAARFTVASAKLGDEQSKTFSVDVPGMGIYEFAVAGDVPLVRSISVRKVRVGEVIDKDWTGGWTIERAGDGRVTNVLTIDYTNDGDQWVPTSESFTRTTTRSGKKEKGGNIEKVTATSISDFSIGDSSRAWFVEIPLMNGIPVTVEGKEGLAYSYVDGRIVRGIDHESIAEIDGVRFRKPTGHRWKWYGFCAAVIVGLVVVLVYVKRSGKG